MTETDSDLAPFTGDLLTLFGADDPPNDTRSPGGAWAADTGVASWPLWYTQPAEGWKGTPCTTASRGDLHVRLLGELYGLRGADPRELLLDVAAGRENAHRLNGHYLLLAWDEAARELRVWTDRFGTLHAYHATSGSRAAVGTFYAAVAASASARQLDWLALTGFLGFGFFPHDRTFYDDVRILRPASLYVFDRSGRIRRQERYATWHYTPDTSRTYDDTVSEFARVFGEVMADHISTGHVAVPISGGLDSRSTVAEIREPTDRVWAYSYGYSADSIETGIARRLAKCRALAFDEFVIGPYLFDHIDIAVASVEGFQDITQCRQAAVAEEIARRADYVIAAHWGDVWLDDMGLVGSGGPALDAEAVTDHTLHKIEKRGRAWLLDNVARSHLNEQDPRELLRDIVRQELASVAHMEDPDFRVKAFKTDNWSFRWTLSSVRMYQPGAFPRLPFYDTRIADFFQTVPSAYVAGRRLQIDYLKRYAPDLARVTWQARYADLYHCDRPAVWALPKRAFKKLGRIVRGRHVIERNWEVQFAGERGREGLREWLLRPGLRLHDLVPPMKVRSLLDAFDIAPLEQGRGYTVSMLLSLSAWLERYG